MYELGLSSLNSKCAMEEAILSYLINSYSSCIPLQGSFLDRLMLGKVFRLKCLTLISCNGFSFGISILWNFYLIYIDWRSLFFGADSKFFSLEAITILWETLLPFHDTVSLLGCWWSYTICYFSLHMKQSDNHKGVTICWDKKSLQSFQGKHHKKQISQRVWD